MNTAGSGSEIPRIEIRDSALWRQPPSWYSTRQSKVSDLLTEKVWVADPDESSGRQLQMIWEAWAEGTPVIVHRHCAVLAGQVGRSGGGVTVGDYATFAAALDDLWHADTASRERGKKGRAT